MGFLKPVGQRFVQYKGLDVDKDVALMAEIFNLDEEDLPWMSPVIIKPKFTQEFLDGKIRVEDLEKKITDARDFLSNKYDYLVVEGTGHAGVGSAIGLNNARVSCLLGAPVVINYVVAGPHLF